MIKRGEAKVACYSMMNCQTMWSLDDVMSIRQADVKDIEKILFVINESNSEAYREIIPPEYFKEPFLSLDELLEDLEEMTFYAYKVKQSTIGVVALKIESEEVGEIRWLYILPTYQRKGVGTSLVSHIEKEAMKMRLKKLAVLTNEKAYWARNFYKKLGYKRVNRIPRLWGGDVVYEKTLI